jgi:four helix bundle protein
MASQSYRDLFAWQRAMDLVELAYRHSRRFPKEEMFALTSQLRRSAVSVPSNIAEGQGRGTNPEFVHFLRIAHGSLRELETQFLIARRLEYMDDEQLVEVLSVAATVGKLLHGLMKSKR